MKNIFYIPVITTILGAIIAGLMSFSAPPEYEGILFTTLVSADKNSSIAEKEGASHFFAETVVGWTHSPTFRNTVLQSTRGSFSGQKQERQNIVFTISSQHQEDIETISSLLKHTLNTHLNTINTSSETDFKLLYSNLEKYQKAPKSIFGSIAGMVVGFFIGMFAISAIHWWRQRKT